MIEMTLLVSPQKNIVKHIQLFFSMRLAIHYVNTTMSSPVEITFDGVYNKLNVNTFLMVYPLVFKQGPVIIYVNEYFSLRSPPPP